MSFVHSLINSLLSTSMTLSYIQTPMRNIYSIYGRSLKPWRNTSSMPTQQNVFSTKTEVKFCGHIIGNGTVRVMQDKIKAINDWPQPRMIHHIRQFLGLAGYYRRFIKG